MTIDHTIILTTIIFLVVVWLIAWIISSHRFRTLIFAGLYLAAIAPNFATLTTSFSFDLLIMLWFDSLFIYILFSIYLATLIIMFVFEKGWLKTRLLGKSNLSGALPGKFAIDEATVKLVTQTVEHDLKETFPGQLTERQISQITTRDQKLMEIGQVSPTQILEIHNKCLVDAKNTLVDGDRKYLGCRVGGEGNRQKLS